LPELPTNQAGPPRGRRSVPIAGLAFVYDAAFIICCQFD